MKKKQTKQPVTYYGFRLDDGDPSGPLTIVARITDGNHGKGFSSAASNGESGNFDPAHLTFSIDPVVAEVLIDIIKDRKPLPEGFVARLPVFAHIVKYEVATKICGQCKSMVGSRCETFLPPEDDIYKVKEVTDSTPACSQFEALK